MVKTDTPNSTFVPILDSLRGIAALSVCLFHFICTVIGFVYDERLLTVFEFGKYGVQMFFVISGFIIPWSMYHNRYQIRNFFAFTAKRLIRLEPPYLISLILAIFITFARTLGPHFNGVDVTPSVNQVLLHFGYLIPFFEDEKWIRAVYWTLAVEFQYYFSIGLLFPLIVNKRLGYRMLMYFLFLIAPLVAGVAYLPHYLPVFLLGILLFLYKAKIIDSKEIILVSIVTFCSIIFFLDIATFSFSLFTFMVIFKFSDIKSKVGDFLGKISYSLYLFHGLTGLVFINYFSHTVSHPALKCLLVIFAMGVTIFSSYIVFRFIELPSKRLSSSIKFKKEK